jgi:tripartite-type tricarboxylate transporter receptor subunit TctC
MAGCGAPWRPASGQPCARGGALLAALAVMTAKRSPELPDVPTLAEAAIPGSK